MTKAKLLQNNPLFAPSFEREERDTAGNLWVYYSCQATGWRGKFRAQKARER